ESRDAVLHVAEGRNESSFLLYIKPVDGGWDFYTPMRGHRLSGPDRTGLGGGVVADGENEIHDWRVWAGELLPALRAEALDGIVEALQHLQREWIDRPLRLRTGGEGKKASLAILVQDAFREDRARRVAGAQ